MAHPFSSSDAPFPMQTFAAFARAMHAHRQLMSRKVAEHGVHPGQALCMREIAHDPGITQRDLAEKLAVARPTVTVMVQKLERAGLVQRRSDPSDNRFTRLFLTPAGTAQHETMHGLIAEIADETIATMSEADQRELKRLLELFTQNMNASANPDREDPAR